jgi:hypothetical protein
MSFCPECGTDHHAGERSGGVGDEVKIAKIRADAEVEIAKIQRGMVREETAAEVEVEEIRAEADVEVAGELAEALADAEPPAEEPPAEPEPVMVEPEPDAPEMEPPVVTGGHHEAKSKPVWGWG